jgi:triacylglycerol lipase
VGPLSSNWERAVETFYQIKGGQVDYGKNHSDKWGIIQKPEGKYYSGLYPEWDRTHPVHFIGHSMGGQTIRMLAYQLTHSFQSDSIFDDDENILMDIEHRGWIKSITSISTPHDGTTLSNLVSKTIPFLQNFIILGAVVETKYYNFDLQHWGFNRKENESWINYYKRIRNHPSWNTKNICSWDLSIDGAQELNTTLIAQPDIYYFSFTTSSTHKNNKSGKHLPDKNTSMLLRIRSRIIGSKTVRFADGTSTDSLWFENDGVVNTISQKGPTTGENGADPLTYYISSESVIPGQWYNMGKIKFDHWKIIGQGKMTIKEEEFLLSLYLDHCKRLWNLPN